MSKILTLGDRTFKDSFDIESEAKTKGVSLSGEEAPYNLRLFLKGELPLTDAQRISQISATAFEFDDGSKPEEVADFCMHDANYVFTINYSTQIIGYANGWIIGEPPDVLHHFGGAAIFKEHQNKGLYSLLNKLRMVVEPAQTIQTRTGNPKVVSSLQSLAKLSGYTFYPNGEVASDYIKELIDWYYVNSLPIKNGLVNTSTLVWSKCYPDGTDGQLVYLIKEF